MKPPAFTYTAPESLDEALDLLAQYGDDAKPLSGGQSLMPLLNMRFAQPSVIVDLNGITALGSIAREGGDLQVGAMVRQADFGRSPLVREHVPLAAATVPHIGHFVTRNRGTVGGSLAHADARAELPLALVALGGRARVASQRGGVREIAADELFVTHFTTSLQADELLVSSAWPTAQPGWRFAFEEFAQRHGDYALAMVGVGVRMSDGHVAEARVAVSAVGDRPTCIAEAGRALIGRDVDREAAREAGAVTAAQIEPHDDMHASARYRRHLTAALVERASLAALGADDA